jgi:hypothetical protein
MNESTVTSAEKRAEKAAKLDAAIAEYEEKLKNLEEKLENLQTAAKPRKRAPEPDPALEEYIDIKLYKGDTGLMKEDVYVSINGDNCVIPRGRWFKIRKKFALVIDQSEIQDQRTLELIESESRKWERANG